MADERVVGIFEKHRRRVLSVLPDAEVCLSGSALVADIKVDDVDLVALVTDVAGAAERLRDLYPPLYEDESPLYEDEWRDDWAAFRTPSSPQVDIVVTRRGTKGDAHHRRAWDLLATDDRLLADYRALKATSENYAERKAAFFERVVSLLPNV